MRIGIDIDDTITNSWEYLLPYYSRLFNIKEEVLHQRDPYFASIEGLIDINIDDFFEKIRPVYDGKTEQITLQNHVKETIDLLYEQGHKVYFITARGKGFTDAYSETKSYLDKHGIRYEKLITGAWNKSISCQEEQIDLFIDDSYKHCKEVADIGIKVLMPSQYYNQKYTEYKHFSDWYEVYDYITNSGV